MLTLRQSQMESLVAPQRAIFEARAVLSLARLFAGDPRLDDSAELGALVRDASSRAGAYGLSRERDLLLFVYLVFDQGPGFASLPHQPWIEGVLGDAGLAADEKMDVIYARLALAAAEET